MYDYIFSPDLSKSLFYKELLIQTEAIVTGQRNWVTNLANVSSLIFHGLNALNFFKEKPVNWAGFYVKDVTNPNILILGPFQGKVACTQIRIGKGVCGTAALTKLTQVVKNVHEFPGHIACDSSSLSEIVVPLIDPKTVGCIDLMSMCNFKIYQGQNLTLKNCKIHLNIHLDINTGNVRKNEVIGVLDIDDMCLEAFDEEDKIGLEAVASALVKASDW